MIRHSIALLALVSLPLVVPRAAAPEAASGANVFAQDETELQKAMQTLKAGQRKLKKLIVDPAANEEAMLEFLSSMEAAALLSLAEAPPQPEGMAGKEAALFRVGYKRQTAVLLEKIFALQDAALRVDAEALAAAYGELGDAKALGHETYGDF